MTSYRILKKENTYRVQTWDWYWPLWSWAVQYTSIHSRAIREFTSIKSAQEYVETRKRRDSYRMMEWKVINE